MVVRVNKVKKEAQLPTYGTGGAACFDLYAAEGASLLPSETKKVTTGLVFEVPEGYEMIIRPRSGLSLNTGIRIPNSPATIDSDYRGEVAILLWNAGKDKVHVREGDRIAQGQVRKIERCDFIEAKLLGPTDRGEEGFGSTGK